jgi:acyl-ACP thioesterase
MKYEKKYQVNYYNVDNSFRLSLTSLLRFFEDLAITHSDASGLGFDFYNKNKVLWFLTRWLVKIESLPKLGDEITIVTSPSAFNNFYANREFEVYDSSLKLIITANTLWVFLDAATRKPKRVPEEVYHGYGLSDDGKKYFTKLEEIKPVDEAYSKVFFKILRRDLDYNNHLNNSHYVTYGLETIPTEIQDKLQLTDVVVNYLQEAYINESIAVSLKTDQTEESVSCINTISRDNTDLCRVKTVWKNKSRVITDL